MFKDLIKSNLYIELIFVHFEAGFLEDARDACFYNSGKPSSQAGTYRGWDRSRRESFSVFSAH